MAHTKSPESFVDALTHRISSIHNPEFEGFSTLPGMLDIHSCFWRITVSFSTATIGLEWHPEAHISSSSTSTQKSYALTLLACIEAIEEFNSQEPSESSLLSDLDVGSPEPFCACGRRISQCDRSRKGCKGA
jgi:hypothetical protein